MNKGVIFAIGVVAGATLPVMHANSHGLYKALALENMIRTTYHNEEELSSVDFNEDMLRGICSGLDKYTCYFTEDEYSEFLNDTTAEEFCGIGVRHILQRSTEDYKVTHVFPGGGAEEAGIQVGDILAAVDDQILTGMTSEDVTNLIRGKEGTQLKLGVLRGDDSFEVMITRRRVAVHDVDAEVLPDGTGYIRINEFTGTCVDDFTEAFKIVSNCDNCIIDLQNNPGGQVEMLIAILNQFVPDNLIARCEYRSLDDEDIVTTGGAIFPFEQCLILIDSGTASCSEVMAGALRDLGFAKLVGETTYGKGLIQGIRPFGKGAVKMTIGTYVLPSGFDLGGVGLTPDYKYKGDDIVAYALTLFDK